MGRPTTMDNDTTTATTSTRQGRQRRRLIAGAIAVAVIAGAIIVGGSWQNSQNATSGALGANVCPTVNPTTKLPSIVPVAEVDWSGCNLTGIKLIGAYMWGSNLSGANLTDANLTGVNLTGANLTNANLTGAVLATNYWVGSPFRVSATFLGATMTGVRYANTICPDSTQSNSCVGKGGGL